MRTGGRCRSRSGSVYSTFLHDGAAQLRHTALVLCFTRAAHRRGYQVQVLPAIDPEISRAVPDVYVQKGAEWAFVEVESSRRGKSEKWQNLLDLQGFAAVCVASVKRRENLIAKGYLGFENGDLITDLETLRQRTLAGYPGSLWIPV